MGHSFKELITLPHKLYGKISAETLRLHILLARIALRLSSFQMLL